MFTSLCLFLLLAGHAHASRVADLAGLLNVDEDVRAEHAVKNGDIQDLILNANLTKTSYTPVDDLVPTFDCASRYYFKGAGSLADIVETAHEWCRADLVPEDKRVPEFLRGLYWMKDLELPDVAFCPSLGEWEGRGGGKGGTLKLAVWTHFVFRKEASEVVAGLAQKAAKLPFPISGPLIYTIDFPDDSFTHASIYTNSVLINRFIKFPLEELPQTEDGKVVSQKKGDVWNRPSFFGFGIFTDWLKFENSASRYYAVRVMDDDGTINQGTYSMMKKAEMSQTKEGGSFVRYASEC